MSRPAVLPSPSAAPAPPASASVGFNLAIIAAIIALAGLALVYGIDTLARPAKPIPSLADAGAPILRTLAGKDLTIPAAWLRNADRSAAGFVNEVALELQVPLGPNGRLLPISATLVPLNRFKPSALLLDRVYLQQFSTEQRNGPLGLIGKPLEDDAGLQGETVWYDPLSPTPFVAKCGAPVGGEGVGRCMRIAALTSSIGVIYDFSAEALDQWRRFDAELRPWFSRIGID